jgi:hypothetical protein
MFDDDDGCEEEADRRGFKGVEVGVAMMAALADQPGRGCPLPFVFSQLPAEMRIQSGGEDVAHGLLAGLA